MEYLNMIEGYERVIEQTKNERDKSKLQVKALTYALVLSLFIGGFAGGYLYAINIELKQDVKTILNSSDVPETLKKKIINNNI